MGQEFKKFNKQKQNKPFYVANQFIRHSMVRVVGDDIQSDVYPIAVALKMAQDANLDLVEISPDANPPVCRIIALDKYAYQQKRKKKEQEQQQKKSNGALKEIRMSSNTNTHDLIFKTKHAENFLKDNNKVKVVILFKGRNIIYKEFGEDLLKQMTESLEQVGSPESMPTMEGNRMIMMFRPKKK